MAQGFEQVMGPGKRLRAAREALGKKQEDIAQEMRLHPDVIRRIEADDYDSQMPLVFFKGYLRAFAGLVGVDPEQVIIEFTQLGLIDPVRALAERNNPTNSKLSSFQTETHKNRSFMLWGILGALVCGMLGFMWFQYEDTPVENQSIDVPAPQSFAPEEVAPHAPMVPAQIEVQAPAAQASPAAVEAPKVNEAPVRQAPKAVTPKTNAPRVEQNDTSEDEMLF
jgi:cytoskeleton protein RodZ